MNRSMDVRNEVRKLASSKPVHAAAGVGVLASQALRELPARLAKLRHDETLVSLPARATEYMLSMRAKAVSEYERLASAGQKAMTEHAPAIASGNGGLNGKGAKSSTARSAGTRSATPRSTKAK